MRISRAVRISPLIVLAVFSVLIFIRDNSKRFEYISIITNEIVGVSLWSNFVMLYYAMRHKLCAYYYLCIAGFFVLNANNILQQVFDMYNLEYEYFNIYVGILSLIILLSSILFFIFKYEK